MLSLHFYAYPNTLSLYFQASRKCELPSETFLSELSYEVLIEFYPLLLFYLICCILIGCNQESYVVLLDISYHFCYNVEPLVGAWQIAFLKNGHLGAFGWLS